MCCDGPDIPDTSAATMEAVQSNERIAANQFARQDEMFQYFKDRQVGVDAIADEVTQRELAMSEETAAQGRDWYNYQKEVFRPVEQSMVAQAMRESTPEFYEKYAQESMARQAVSNANAQGQMERTMAGMGVNPNSGAYMAQQRGLQLQNAAAMGAAGNDARDRAEALGWARRADVAGLGKGLVGAGNASYGLATGSNSAAANATNAANAQAGMLGSPTQYAQIGANAQATATNAYTDIYRTQTQAAMQQGGSMDGLMGIAGQAMGGWASGGFKGI